jgi:hypothetical protein
MTGTVAKDAPANYARHHRTMWKTALEVLFLELMVFRQHFRSSRKLMATGFEDCSTPFAERPDSGGGGSPLDERFWTRTGRCPVKAQGFFLLPLQQDEFRGV